MLKPVFIISLLVSFVFLANNCGAKSFDEHIYLLPAGTVDKKIVEEIKKRLPDCFPMAVKVMIEPRENIPEDAYDLSRKQYDAEVVLDDISARVTMDTAYERTLVIVDVDLYAPELDFVFGLSNAKSGMCIISLARLRNEFYNLTPDYKLFIDRAVKEAVHEVGHSWGLDHCPNPRCVMFFSNSLSDTDKKKSEFCIECQKALRRRYGRPLFGSMSPLGM